ncbi:GNAT family N-acetyltransferase [Micromonospora sp. ZYX-F-536]|uniref:GNAT family N-acetyltransferase n=1 Tax=Micromonospora sp. ZYX-F-536 TaxID=3457629 RepID=UPI004040C3EC
MIETRVLTPHEWPTWRELRLAALTEAPDAFGARLSDWQGDGDREERWRNRLSIPGSHNLVAVLDGRPVGMASGVPTPDPLVMELISMWVCPEARGHGVGHRLVDAVAQWAKELGAHQVRLNVAPHNTAATTLYRRSGFTPTNELGDLLPSGAGHAQVMTRQL